MWFRKHSKFYSFFYYFIKSTIASEKSFPSFILPKDYYGLDDTKPGWRDFKKYTTLIKNFCEENNVKYFFVLIPTLTNLNDNYPYREVNQKVEEFTNLMEIAFFSLFNVFYGYNAEDLWVSGANTHWNAKATQIAAEHLSAFLYNNNIFR
ncbi:MAG: hypothetical protein K8F60_13970 [Melioribacteraceae bacterium]|nr:hypothetical protein [Melioribacteraceae bacterium]